jgi:hypothetical protein
VPNGEIPLSTQLSSADESFEDMTSQFGKNIFRGPIRASACLGLILCNLSCGALWVSMSSPTGNLTSETTILNIGGAFLSYNGITEKYAARINSNGSLNTTFSPLGSGLTGQVTSSTIDSSGRLLDSITTEV